MKTLLTIQSQRARLETGSSRIGEYPIAGGVEPPPQQSLTAAESFRTFFCEERTLASDVSAASVLPSQRSSRARGDGVDE